MLPRSRPIARKNRGLLALKQIIMFGDDSGQGVSTEKVKNVQIVPQETLFVTGTCSRHRLRKPIEGSSSTKLRLGPSGS